MTGYLLLLASRGQGSGAAGSIDTVQPLVDTQQASRLAAVPGDLLPVADHLRQVGLLPKWVHWLLQQLPQRPELFERAFTRLFQQVGIIRRWNTPCTGTLTSAGSAEHLADCNSALMR